MSVGETHLDADEVASAAAMLAVTSEGLAERISDPLRQIRSIHAAEPWGHDDAGTAFRRSYLGTGDGADSAADGILDGSDALCGRVYTLAEGTGVGALESERQDEDHAAEINRLHTALTAHGAGPPVLPDQAAVEMLGELQGMMRDPRVPEIIGDGSVAEIEGFLEDAEQLAE